MELTHYLAVIHLPRRRELEVGALGTHGFEPGDYVYIGRARSGFDARLARHSRTTDKSVRWHVDYLREAGRWVGARTPEASSECELADRIAEHPEARRTVAGFGASDCNCDGHLVQFDGRFSELPGPLWRGDGVEARYLDRPNRFVVEIELEDGETARAYLPNTARLTELIFPGQRILVEPADDPDRATGFTVRRIWDGTWVGVEATDAEALLERHWSTFGRLPGLGEVADVASQVDRRGHRFDYRLERGDGSRLWLEVKSLSRCFRGDAVLSGTPSRRGIDQLETLSELVDAGEPAATAFVLQRNDPERLVVGDPGIDPNIDDDWVRAVRDARERGVEILAYCSRVTPSNAWLDAPIPVVDAREV